MAPLQNNPGLEFLSFPSSSQLPVQHLETGFSQGASDNYLTYPTLPPPLIQNTAGHQFQSFPSSPCQLEAHYSLGANEINQANLSSQTPLIRLNEIVKCDADILNVNTASFQDLDDQFLKYSSPPPPLLSSNILTSQGKTAGPFDPLQQSYFSGNSGPFDPMQQMPPMQNPELQPGIQPSSENANLSLPYFPSGIFPIDFPGELRFDDNTTPDYLNWDTTDENVDQMEALLEEELAFENSIYSKPVYNGAPLTLHESLVSILSVALKYSLSGQLINSILGLIDLHLPREDNIFKKSLYLFKKYFSEIRGYSSYTYYCSKCLEKCDKSRGCLSCEKKTPLCCLILLSVVDQLKALMARKGFYSKLVPLRSRFNTSGYADIYDGELYKDYVKNNYIGELPSLSCEWYTDGAEMFKSAHISVWNLFLSINELPYCERYKKKNLLIPALWVGPAKPPTNLFFDAAKPELTKLGSGVEMEIADLGTSEEVSLKVTGGTGDTPARALVLNMVAHNGEYACQCCLQKGKCRDNCPGSVRVFPYDENQMIARTKENFESHGKWARKLKNIDPSKTYMGLHGTTPLSDFTIDPIRGTGIDIMHNLWGGCGKLNLSFFVDASSKYSSLPCHLNKLQRELVDDRLLKIKPPHYLTRVPKSIKEVASWQTSIHKSMCLYYDLPVLQDIVKEDYFIHYSTLVAAAQIINSDVITPDDLNVADLLFKKYVSRFPDLYQGDTYMTINVHLLLHLVFIVHQKGPAWASACFPLESVNGEILKLIHGPRYPEMQIVSSLHMSLCLEDLVNNLPTSATKDFCCDLLSTTENCKQFKFGENVIQGKWQQLERQPPEYLKMLISTHPSLQDFHITTFNYLRRKKILYAAESFRKTQARDSSAILYSYNNSTRTGIIKDFIRASQCQCKACLCDCRLFAVVQELEVVEVFKTLVPDVNVPNTHQYRRQETFILLPVCDLISVSVKMDIGSRLYISKRSNNQEIE
ncbi:hypothetical protein FOCC_FOCC012656 [Frankliniella occidentalis]|nr:hypothetical protein FOCC_FOCC012656 [Frankliniella occidentalis]